MKKLLFVGIITLFLSPVLAFAAVPPSSEFVPLVPIPNLTEHVNITAGLGPFLNNLYKFLIGFAAVAAVVMIVWGGIQYATTDNISNKSEGKAKIQQAIFGLILILIPYLVFYIINPKILDLEPDWQALK